MRYELINNNIEKKKLLDIVLKTETKQRPVKKIINANEFENPFNYRINEAVKNLTRNIKIIT